MSQRDIKNLTVEEFRDWLAAAGQKPFRADQIRQWLYKHQVFSFDAMDNLPAALRDRLAQDFYTQSLEEHARQNSADGTIKFAFRTRDHHFIETVMIPSEERFSVCVSTQIGCAMGCAFCRTARMGIIRNLETGEIVEQIMRVNQLLKAQGKEVTNVIFMGMGEPLQNFENVHRTCEILHNQKFFNMGRKRLTVSTSGIVPRIIELADRNTPCMLAVSLNGTNDAMRSMIMPVNRRWPLAELLAAVDEYIRKTENYVTFEYVLIRGITATPQAARELLKIAQQRRCKINAIVLNPGDDPQLESPTPEEVDEFMRIVRAGHVHIHLRTPRGRDILAACGQLAIHQKKKVA